MGTLVKEGYQVIMDSNVENATNVFNENGSYIKFLCVYRTGCIVSTSTAVVNTVITSP